MSNNLLLLLGNKDLFGTRDSFIVSSLGLGTSAVASWAMPDKSVDRMLSDFGLDKYVHCGKMVMGYEKENHSTAAIWPVQVIEEK